MNDQLKTNGLFKTLSHILGANGHNIWGPMTLGERRQLRAVREDIGLTNIAGVSNVCKLEERAYNAGYNYGMGVGMEIAAGHLADCGHKELAAELLAWSKKTSAQIVAEMKQK